MGEVNVPLLRKCVEWAEAEAAKPRELCEWEQGYWSLTREERDDWRRRSQEIGRTVRGAYDKAPECGTCYCIAGFVVAQAGRPIDEDNVEVEAAELLGISHLGLHLFNGSNSIADVRRIAEDLAGERF